MNNEAALYAYMAKMEAARVLIEALAEWAEDMGGVSPDDVKWTHVGDLTETLKELRGAATWAGIDIEALQP